MTGHETYNTQLRRRCLRLMAAALLLCPCTKAAAQTDATFTQYYNVPTYYNPAAVGQTDLLRIRGGARLQWLGIDNAPKTFAATADMPFKFLGKRFGTGVVISQESIGLYRTLNLHAQIGYKFKKWGGEFTGGVALGMYDQSFKGSEVYLPDEDDYHQGTDDGIPTQDLHGTAFDVSAGIWYQHPKFWAGISCSHLTAPTVTLSNDAGDASAKNIYEFKTGRTLYFMAGSNIPLKNTLFELMPSMLVRTDYTFYTAEVTARASYSKFLTFGVGYRYNDAVYAVVGATFKGFFVEYSYDYPTGAIAKASSGSHEITAGYSLKLNLGAKNPYRHKAIRLM